MFDIGFPEFAVIAILALIVVGPKELPKVLKTVMGYIRKAKSMAREFQSGVDDMVREAELDDVKKTLTEGSDELKKDLEDTVGADITKDLDISDDVAEKVTSQSDSDVDINEILEPSDDSNDDEAMPISRQKPAVKSSPEPQKSPAPTKAAAPSATADQTETAAEPAAEKRADKTTDQTS